MKTTLKVFAWIGIVCGTLAIFGAAGEEYLSEAVYALLGGGLFLAWGIVTLVAIKKYFV